ncbi:peptidylprolyl isomerase [Methylocucumis oryzae]|uniref:peptidylprolyl isomerase n=1 Tax=Methylocucumis oryzae TaxID=1632867 RepID=UPI000A90B785|nr:peptidylprolyl isomerase [Methylocucumis oryzae]
MPTPELPKDDEISAYYQQHQDQFQSPEQVSVDYIELKLADIAAKVEVNDEKLKAYYEEQKQQYTNPERRKISHILFAVNDKATEQSALQKAQQAQQQLKTMDFAEVAKQLSDDKLTAKNGGDLGLFTQGVMEKPFEAAVEKLALGQISDPVKTSYGYHLIKVTELTPATTKPFDSIKDEVAKAYQKAQAENSFYEVGEKLAELSYQNPDSLSPVADGLALPVKKSALFTKDKGEGIAENQKIREAAFSEEVLQGNNSSPIELGSDGLAVIRLLEHKQAAPKDLASVKNDISAILMREKAKTQLEAQVKTIKQRLNQGEKFDALAAEFKFTVKTAQDVLRRTADIAMPLREAIFKAAKPVGDKATVTTAVLPDGQQAVVRIVKVTEGEMSETDKKQTDIAKENIANLYGQDEFAALLTSLEKSADITVHQPAVKPEQEQE